MDRGAWQATIHWVAKVRHNLVLRTSTVARLRLQNGLGQKMAALLPWWLRRQRISLQYGRPGFDPWKKDWLPTPVFLSGKTHGQRSLVGYSPWGRKESDRTERLSTARHNIYVMIQTIPSLSVLCVCCCCYCLVSLPVLFIFRVYHIKTVWSHDCFKSWAFTFNY